MIYELGWRRAVSNNGMASHASAEETVIGGIGSVGDDQAPTGAAEAEAPSLAATIEFLERLHPNRDRTLASFKPSPHFVTETHTSTEQTEAWVRDKNQQSDVYILIGETAIRAKKPKKSDMTGSRWLWVDIDKLEHEEGITKLAGDEEIRIERPRCLKAQVKLHDHQGSGIALMQQLFRATPHECRGVLLADDMGLGKTLQLLTLLAWAFERDKDLDPAMIVAPVALLGNWKEEITKFIEAGALRVMTAYGDALAKLRVPRESVEASLRQEGLVRFLKQDWRGDAQVVLTTYETLRDLEFTFASERWSIVICDEAQKIKNPNAQVTRAAKKLNARFRVACTGTPVENGLADLWCLFDFIQPGLLGALNDFGRSYGRIIESGGPESESKTEELRAKIEPQVIRRTKAEVAKDLPEKISVPGCHMELSSEQRDLYVGALQWLTEPPAEDAERRKVHHLGLLQYLRLICADPRPYDVETFVPEDLGNYRRKAPKMDWLLRTLQDIQRKDEKVLIFAEHRDVQRMIQHYIKDAFGIQPRIVNGETRVSPKAEQNRQKIIREFQAAPRFGVIILSPLAVGFGVNIQAANHVIHYLRHWNPAKEDQATDRAYRIGQKKDVHVYCPLSTASDFKTFDVKLDELLELKRSLAGDMLRGAGSLSNLDIDLREIVPEAFRTPKNDRPVTMNDVERFRDKSFESVTAALWAKMGWKTYLTPQSDSGVDVVATRGCEGCLIQCKSSGNPDRRIGWDGVKEVVGGTATYQEIHPGVRFKRLCVTNQRFNDNAHQKAKSNEVELIEQDRLESLLSDNPVGMLDVCLFPGPRESKA